MVRRFVQDQKVGVGRDQPGQRRPVPLAAAQAADALQHHVADQAKPGQQIAPLLFVEFLVPRRPDRLDDGSVLGQARQQLVVVADSYAGAERDLPGVGPDCSPIRQRSSVVLPVPLGPRIPHCSPRSI